jgi:phosphotriesterase-related protein
MNLKSQRVMKTIKYIQSYTFYIFSLLIFSVSLSCDENTAKLKIMTVKGQIPASQIGITLTHEHVLVDFIGADSISRDRYNPEEVYKVVLPYLKEVKELGCQTFIECTPAYLGRDPELLVRLSEATGLNIITNTGYYGARQNQHLPYYAFEETAGQLANRWTKEWLNGIDETEVRPGFIKIAVDQGELTDVHNKLVRAAARTHLKTGMAIASHTGPATGAFEEIELLKEEGVDPSAFIWVHAQVEENLEYHVKAAQMGVWVSFDGLGWEKPETYVQLLNNMKSYDLLHKVLISHDAGWYHVGEPNGGDFIGFTTLFNKLLPALKETGFTDDEITLLLVTNPAQAFSIRIKNY